MKLYEKYRPETFTEVRGQEKAILEIQTIIDLESWGGQAWYITGSTGTGKTTIARIIASMGATPAETFEIDAADLNFNQIREISNTIKTRSMFGGRAWIINEAHLMRGDILSKLLVVLEEIAIRGQDTIIFTTTKEGSSNLFDDNIDSKPFVGRCNMIQLTNQGLKAAIVERLQEIANLENIPFNKTDAEKIVKATGNTFREAIQLFARQAVKIRLAAIA